MGGPVERERKGQGRGHARRREGTNSVGVVWYKEMGVRCRWGGLTVLASGLLVLLVLPEGCSADSGTAAGYGCRSARSATATATAGDDGGATAARDDRPEGICIGEWVSGQPRVDDLKT